MNQAADVSPMVSSGVTGVSYTFSKNDAGRVIEGNNALAQTLTLPLVSTAGFTVGTLIQVYQQGAGQITIAATGGVTLRSSGNKYKTAAQYSVINLRMRANDEWVVAGDTAV